MKPLLNRTAQNRTLLIIIHIQQTILQEYIQRTTLPTALEVQEPHICEDQNSWHQNIVTDLKMIMQPVFWAYMQETQVLIQF